MKELIKIAWTDRDTILKNGLKYWFGAAITLVYAAVIIFIADLSYKFMANSEMELPFSIKGAFMLGGAVMFLGGVGLIAYILLMRDYLKIYNWVLKKLNDSD